MQYRQLGKTDLNVSLICLGTMTWGEQNTAQQGHAQLDMAVDHGVNFIDVAELYPVPPKADSYGETERILGQWLNRQDRSRYIIATKVTGRADFDYMRPDANETRLSTAQINYAINQSLQRLQTDYVDLYQLHWPDRETNYFGKLGFSYKADDDAVALEESLGALEQLRQAGKIRHTGLSNETPWGMMQAIRICEKNGWQPPVTIQNPYSLLNRSFEVGCAEVAHREQMGLLAYSPLGFGVLSGKYLDNQHPAGARLSLFDRFTRYTNGRGIAATQAYVQLARDHGLDPAQMALAYVNTRGFMTANIIGATTLEQLRSNLESINVTLSADVLKGIEHIHEDNPNPCP